MKEDFYALVGVERDASPEVLATAFSRALAATDDSARRVLLRHARDVLCSPERRTGYDRGLQTGLHVSQTPVSSSSRGRRHGAVIQEQPPLLSGRLWLGLISLALLIGGLGYRLGKPKVTNSAAEVRPVLTVPQVHTSLSPTIPVPTTAAKPNANLSPEDVYAMVAPSVLVVEALDQNGMAASRGSGVVVGPDLVITNCHVVAQASAVRVRSGRTEYSATSDTSDNYLDLCTLRVASLGIPSVVKGSVTQVRVGQTVYAVGTPQGLERTLSQGLVSALRETPDGTLIQTSAAISPGSSGGGLFDPQGRLVGITTFQHKMGQNLNFALPVDSLDKMRSR